MHSGTCTPGITETPACFPSTAVSNQIFRVHRCDMSSRPVLKPGRDDILRYALPVSRSLMDSTPSLTFSAVSATFCFTAATP